MLPYVLDDPDYLAFLDKVGRDACRCAGIDEAPVRLMGVIEQNDVPSVQIG